jgi:glycosyltransferase involved in cell wall biosynthesis
VSTGQPIVGVVTPVYNGAAFLAEAIESVLAQSYPHWHHLILDNCSQDDSAAIAAAYAARDRRIRLVQGERHLPMVANWNATARLLPAEAAYYKPLHADDTLLHGCLEQMVAVAEAHPTVVVVGAQRTQGETLSLVGLPADQSLFSGREIGRRFLLNGLLIFGSPTSTMARADLVRRRDPLYSEDNLHADTELILDLLREGDFGFVHAPLTVSRAHAARNTTFARRMNSFMPGNLLAAQRHGSHYLEPTELREHLALRWRQYDRYLAQAMLQRREPAFWEYHRAACLTLGAPLTRRRLAIALMRFVAERARGWIGLQPRGARLSSAGDR